MKKVLIAVIVLLLLGAGYFFYNKSKGGSIPGMGEGMTSGAKSLKELIAANTPQKCTYSSTDDSGKNEGTTFISGGKVRGDFTNTMSGKDTLSHMITDGKTTYIWTEGEKNGVKMTASEESMEKTEQPGESQSVTSEADLNAKFDYNCSAWIPDNSVFIPPSDIIFNDLSQMMQPSAAPAGGAGTNQCSYCDALSGEDKTSCLSAFNCN